jgi:hypothetical protein
MKQLRYSNAVNPIHFEFPPEWNPKDITALTLTIKDQDATELLAATAVTLFTATSLDGDVNAYASSIILDSATDTPEIGDLLLLQGVEGDSIVKVKAYDSSNYTVELEGILDYDYADDEPVYGMFGNINVDLSNTTTFTLGQVVTLIWTPTGTGQAVTTVAQVSKSALDLEGVIGEFKDVYPRAWDALSKPTGRLATVFEKAESEIELELRAENMEIQRIVDQDEIKHALMTKVVLIWLNDGDENKKDERDYTWKIYGQQMAVLKKLAIWTDDNQDEIKDDSEVSDHEPIFDRGW